MRKVIASPSKEPTPEQETEIYVETIKIIVDPKPVTSGSVLHPDSARHVDIWTPWIPPPPSDPQIQPTMPSSKFGKLDYSTGGQKILKSPDKKNSSK